ncbi:MAG: 6-bladed beta-propeller [Alphaproteobacteria bacterium]
MHNLPQQVIRGWRPVLAAACLLLVVSCQATKTGTGEALVWPDPPEEPRYIYDKMIRSSADVVEETKAERFQRMATGVGIAGKGFDKPWGVAAFDGRVYIGDTLSRKIHYYDLAAKTYSEFGNRGPGSLAKPLQVAVDGKGKVYVCDGTGRRVVIFSQDGEFLGAVGTANELERPSAVAVNADGTRVYVVDTGGVKSEKHHVVVFNQDGEKIQTIGSRGTEEGQFNLPVSAAVAPNGNLYVVDGGNFRVQAFDPTGKFLFTFGTVGRRSGQFARPKDITVDREGNVYVTDSAFGNFQIFDPQGKLLLFIGKRGDSGAPAEYMLPAGIAVDQKDGRVYVVDQFLKKLDIYRPPTTPAERPPRPVTKGSKGGKDAKHGKDAKAVQESEGVPQGVTFEVK